MKKELTQVRIKELMDYDQSTGIFIRLVGYGNVRSGNVAGSKSRDGYRMTMIDGHRYANHRLAFLYVTGEFPDGQVDHINGNRSDNRFCNLRIVSNAENAQNIGGPQRNNKSGYLGVSWHKLSNKWQAQIAVNGCSRHLGLFEQKEDAYLAYLSAKTEVHPVHKRPLMSVQNKEITKRFLDRPAVREAVLTAR